MDTFLAVCQYMNYTRAAEALNITQPAVSQHIRWLEEQYEAPLFTYANKRLSLTREGELLRSMALTVSMMSRCCAAAFTIRDLEPTVWFSA